MPLHFLPWPCPGAARWGMRGGLGAWGGLLNRCHSPGPSPGLRPGLNPTLWLPQLLQTTNNSPMNSKPQQIKMQSTKKGPLTKRDEGVPPGGPVVGAAAPGDEVASLGAAQPAASSGLLPQVSVAWGSWGQLSRRMPLLIGHTWLLSLVLLKLSRNMPRFPSQVRERTGTGCAVGLQLACPWVPGAPLLESPPPGSSI